MTEIYVSVHSESLGVKKSWLKYIEEENKMHCVTCHEAAEIDEYKKCVYSWEIHNLKLNIMSFQKSSEG